MAKIVEPARLMRRCGWYNRRNPRRRRGLDLADAHACGHVARFHVISAHLGPEIFVCGHHAPAAAMLFAARLEALPR